MSKKQKVNRIPTRQKESTPDRTRRMEEDRKFLRAVINHPRVGSQAELADRYKKLGYEKVNQANISIWLSSQGMSKIYSEALRKIARNLKIRSTEVLK